MEHQHEHEWVVFSTALKPGWLMLQCLVCGKHGNVKSPTKKEWKRAFYAPAQPYRWTDASRVTIRGELATPLFAVPKQPGADCGADCPRRQEVGDFERVPAEIIRPYRKLSDEEQRELAEWADFVQDRDLCSSFFPIFVEGYQADAENEASDPVRYIAGRIDAIDRQGLHFRPAIVAFVLREFARVNS